MTDNTEKAALILDRINKATMELYKILPHLKPDNVETWANSLACLIKNSRLSQEIIDETQKIASLTASIEKLETDTNHLKETVDMTQEFGMTEEDLVDAIQANMK